jgi:hypothetical protein
LATENIRIDYQVTGKKELDAANKSLEQTAKANDVTQKEITETNEKFDEQSKTVSKTSKAFNGLGEQLTSIGNRFTIAGKGAGDMASGLFKTTSAANTTSKAMKLLKVAIASTGIGLLVVGLGSLVAFFTKTQRGANIVSKAMAGIGATVNVLIDRLSTFGEGLFKIFSGDFSEGVDILKKSFVGLGAEIKSESTAAVALSDRYEALRVAQAGLTVETRKRRAEIKALNKDAEDTTLSEQERFAAIDKAIRIENELQGKRVELAKESLAILKEQNALSEGTTDDLIAEAEAEGALFSILEESDEMLTTLNNKRNILSNTIKAQRDAVLALSEAEQEAIIALSEAEAEAAILKAEQLEADKEATILIEQEKQDEINRIKEASSKEEMQRDQLVADGKKTATLQGLELLKKTSREASIVGKAASITQAIINTAEGVTKALASAPPPGNLVLAGITKAAGAIQIASIAGLSLPKFEKGGRIGGKRHSQGGTLIEAEIGEHVMNRKATNLYGHNLFDKINNLELDPNIVNGKSGGSNINILDTKPIADQLKSMPQNIVNIDSEGYTLHQSRQQSLTTKKINRYSV